MSKDKQPVYIIAGQYHRLLEYTLGEDPGRCGEVAGFQPTKPLRVLTTNAGWAATLLEHGLPVEVEISKRRHNVELVNGALVAGITKDAPVLAIVEFGEGKWYEREWI